MECCAVCDTGKAEEQCALCLRWICYDHAHNREGDNEDANIYCGVCVEIDPALIGR